MKKALIPIVIIILFLSGCEKAIKINIVFNDIGKLTSETRIFLNDDPIGKVNNVTSSNGKYNVEAYIDKKYADKVTDNTKFYLLSKKDEPRIVMVPGSGNNLNDNDTVIGRSELQYYLNEGYSTVKDIMETIFGSEEWITLKKNINELAEKGYEEGKDRFPQISEKVEMFFETFDEQYGDEIELKVKPFLDSLIKDINSIFEDSLTTNKE